MAVAVVLLATEQAVGQMLPRSVDESLENGGTLRVRCEQRIKTIKIAIVGRSLRLYFANYNKKDTDQTCANLHAYYRVYSCTHRI